MGEVCFPFFTLIIKKNLSSQKKQDFLSGTCPGEPSFEEAARTAQRVQACAPQDPVRPKQGGGDAANSFSAGEIFSYFMFTAYCFLQ